jgi:hypothetical protein
VVDAGLRESLAALGAEDIAPSVVGRTHSEIISQGLAGFAVEVNVAGFAALVADVAPAFGVRWAC